MKTVRLLCFSVLVIQLFGCGGSDGNEPDARQADHQKSSSTELLPSSQESRQESQVTREPTGLLESERPEKQSEETPQLNLPRVSPSKKPASSSQKKKPLEAKATEERLDRPTQSENEARTEPAIVPPAPPEESEVADVPPTDQIANAERESPPRAIIIPPSPPRRKPPGPPVTAELVMQREGVITLPAGTVIEVRTAEQISSRNNLSGDVFETTLTEDLFVEGRLVFGRGTEVLGRLLEVQRPGKVKGRGAVSFDLKEIRSGDTSYALETNTISIEAESTKGKDTAKVGAATAIGAILGAVFGGKKGAAVGGAGAAGAGTAGVLLSRGKDVEIPVERLFSFRLEEDIKIHVE